MVCKPVAKVMQTFDRTLDGEAPSVRRVRKPGSQVRPQGGPVLVGQEEPPKPKREFSDGLAITRRLTLVPDTPTCGGDVIPCPRIKIVVRVVEPGSWSLSPTVAGLKATCHSRSQVFIGGTRHREAKLALRARGSHGVGPRDANTWCHLGTGCVFTSRRNRVQRRSGNRGHFGPIKCSTSNTEMSNRVPGCPKTSGRDQAKVSNKTSNAHVVAHVIRCTTPGWRLFPLVNARWDALDTGSGFTVVT